MIYTSNKKIPILHVTQLQTSRSLQHGVEGTERTCNDKYT